jgi:predicted nucleic acid-binding Zn ribbon protein
MARPPKPDTQREMIDQLWFAVIGANSEGIAERVRRIDDRLQAVENRMPDLMTHRQHDDYVAGCKEEEKSIQEIERRRKWRTTDVVLAVGMLIVTTVSLVGIFV